ncbi:MAG: SGNH/GDSL hydrolase family protein [Deltaproteobacteria bacterium]|nr:SGNH/GDSL hydrolase family protein [Deltaproteobacteria bacterium]
MTSKLPLLLSVALLSSACERRLCGEVNDLEGAPRVLAVGDSVLAWAARRCHSPPDHAALALGEPIENLAVSGTRLLGGEDVIPGQYDAAQGDYSHVILDGGANDLNQSCACGDCDAVLDQLITADASAGALPELVRRVLDDGRTPVLLGYYTMPDDASYGFDRCGPTMASYKSRQIVLAEANPGLRYVDLALLISPAQTPDAYDFDAVHPSEEGAEIIGQALAAAIRQD